MTRDTRDRLLVAGALVALAAAQWVILARSLSVEPFFDEGTYLLSVDALRNGYALGRDVFASQPPLFYDLLHGLAAVFGATLRGLREATIAVSLLALVAAYVLARSLVDRAAGVLAASLLMIAPPFALYGGRIFADTPALALSSVAVALAGAGALVAACAVLAAAVLVKLSAVTALPAVVALGLLARVRPARWLLAAAVAAAVLGVVALVHVHGLGRIWSDAISYHTRASGAEPGLSNSHELRSYFNVRTPFFWLTVAGAAGAAAAGSWRVRAVWLWPAAAVLFVATHTPLHENHLLTLPFAFAPAVGVGLGAGLQRVPHRALVYGVAAVLVAAGYVQQVRSVDSQRVAVDPRLVAVAARVASSTAPGDYVVSDQPYVPVLARRHVPPDLVDTANLRFAAGFLSVARIRADVERYHVRVVVAGRSFRQHPDLIAWLRAHAAASTDVGGIRIYRLRP